MLPTLPSSANDEVPAAGACACCCGGGGGIYCGYCGYCGCVSPPINPSLSVWFIKKKKKIYMLLVLLFNENEM